ncbi:type III pantothenate kinase [Kushneria aurantia]|uniref:Type III pantothenate kinase n=1 Tax=Kushneria aurantia TaxID=504092 RepID=A0ABV6G5U9_9GAMM|nr:type III pantothenate kinase [Kushneria aurantia]
MILDLDIGNTLSKWRLKDSASDAIMGRGAMWTHDEWRFGDDIPDPRHIEAIRISNVARHDVLEGTVALLERRVDNIMVARSTAQAGGVRNGYDAPERLGVDRWLGLIAGHRLAGGCCTVDCGSAVTMDFVLPDGRHPGGYILPGLRLMKESLRLGTRSVAIDPEQEMGRLLAPGSNTADAVNHGVYVAAVSAIQRLYMENCDRYGVALPMLVTGGDGAIVSRGLELPHAQWPDMVYAGLEVLFPLTEGERRGVLAGMPAVVAPPSREAIEKALAFTYLL